MSERKKLAIISSYKENCGNASYTEVLRKEFSKYYDVDILRLDLELTESTNKKLRKLADKSIDEMCQKLKDYDYVNIQFEAGLYGPGRGSIYRRVKKLIWASPNVIVTMHRVDIPAGLFNKEAKAAFAAGEFLQGLKNMRMGAWFAYVYKWVAEEVKKRNRVAPASIIVHTARDRKNIQRIFEVPQVHDFPLTFLNAHDRSREPNDADRVAFRQKYGLQPSDKVIGLFGFVTKYKGHDTAIKALGMLPHEYKVLIFGSQHPASVLRNCEVDRYIKDLMELVSELGLNDRVFFAGSLNDADFIDALYDCDFSVLPYLEVNQSGSGIASLVLESKIKALFSNNKAFAELKRYYPNCFEQFDIGNYEELAYKIQNYRADYRANLEKALETYNLENNIKFHMSIFEGTIDEK